jgi:hypothetical protein
MKQADLTSKLARLEMMDDHIESEFEYLDKLLRLVGFDEGIESLKAAVLIDSAEQDLA